MIRYDCLQVLAPKITNELIVCGVGAASRELYHLKHRNGNLYTTYMSGTTPIALGLALGLPHRRVISIDGDGSILMGLGILPVIAQQNPSNLIVIVIDNEAYEAAGNEPTPTAGPTDLAIMARGAGIQNASLVREPAEFEKALDEAFAGKAASIIVAKVKQGRPSLRAAALDGIENKYRMIRYIEETENIKVIIPPPMRGKNS